MNERAYKTFQPKLVVLEASPEWFTDRHYVFDRNEGELRDYHTTNLGR